MKGHISSFERGPGVRHQVLRFMPDPPTEGMVTRLDFRKPLKA